MAENKNQRGIILLSALDHDGVTLPAGAEITFLDDDLEMALVAAGVARWGKGPVPDSVKPLQILAAIEQAGLKPVLDQIFAADPRAEMMFALASDVRRASPVIDGLRAAANLTVADIDDLFRAAANL